MDSLVQHQEEKASQVGICKYLLRFFFREIIFRSYFFLAKTHFLGQCSQPILIQPKSGRQIHKIPDEIQPASIPLRQFIIIDRCPACQVNYNNNNNYLIIFVKFKKSIFR